MGTEIERKFLLDRLPEGAVLFSVITQGYLSTDPMRTVRIRLEETRNGSIAYITIKSKGEGIARHEFEYAVPFEEGVELMQFCIKPVIKKSRHVLGRWEIDVFHDLFDGLICAEIELESEDEFVELPVWANNEVTNNPEYTNAGLVEGWSNEKNRSVCW